MRFYPLNGKVYIPVKFVMEITGLKKSQIYKMIKLKQLIAESEVIGTDSRHKILVSSVLLWLATKNKFHIEEARRLERAYGLLERSINHG